MRSFPLILALLGVTGIHSLAQNTDDAFKPQVAGAVRCVTVLRNGKLWVGGEFTQVTSTKVQNLACLQWDGVVPKDSPLFEPNGTVLTLLSKADNSLWVGGAFTEIGGELRKGLARVVENDGVRLDGEFAPEFDGEVRCLLADGDGVLVGGNFLRVNGQPRAGVVRLLENGEVDPAFDAKLEGEQGIAVNVMTRQTDGKILLGGLFDMAGRQAVTNLARLYPSGVLDSRFVGSADGEVHAIGVQANGNVMIGGDFLNASGHPAPKIARLNRQGDFISTISGFDVEERVNTIKIQPDGKVLIGGRFGSVPGSGGNFVRYGSELQPEKIVSNVSGEVSCIMPQGDGHVLIGGSFVRADQGNARGLARLDINLRSELTMDTRVSVTGGQITTVVQQPDEKLLFAGSFAVLGGAESNGLVRTNLNGTYDSEFSRPVVGNGLLGIQVRRDQKLWVFGNLSAVSGAPRTGIALLQQSGWLDSSFNANLGGSEVVVNAIADQSQDRLLLGGNFTQVGQAPRAGLARVGNTGGYDGPFASSYTGVPSELLASPTGVLTIGGLVGTGSQAAPSTRWYDVGGNLVSSYNPQVSGKVNGMCRLPDGRIFVWGDSPMRRSVHLERVSSDGKLRDDGPVPSFNGEVRSVSVQADGSMLVLGAFTTCRSGDTTWSSLGGFIHLGPDLRRKQYSSNLSMSPPGQGRAGLVQTDGKFLFWGGFSSANGARPGLARISASVPATQELGVFYSEGQFKVAWQRSGSAPEVERVWLSTSTNGTTWAIATEGKWANGRWEFDKFSLPSGKAVWIRAEGRVPSSGGGDAGGLVQSIRQVFLEGEIDVALNENSLISGDGDEINFGGQVQGVPSVRRTFTITNRGNYYLRLEDPVVPEGFIAGALSSTYLAPGGQTTIEVASDLSHAGVRTGELVIPSDDLDEKDFVIPLKSEALTPLRTTLLKPRTVLNRKTGLREQTIRVRNAAGITYAGYRVVVSGLPHGVVVHNASEQLPDGSYVIVVNQALGPFANTQLKLEYTFPKKTPAKLIPRITAEAILAPAGE